MNVAQASQAMKIDALFVQHVRNAEPWAADHIAHHDMSAVRNLGFALGKIEGIIAVWCHFGFSYQSLNEQSRISYERMYAIWDEVGTSM
jgi:hypothetical protein